ncbi:MAG: hypothetical protein K2V38_16260 [Gemmataceae bacterium]|nr:hypothetical protein [Gemmataceae bacterium]
MPLRDHFHPPLMRAHGTNGVAAATLSATPFALRGGPPTVVDLKSTDAEAVRDLGL